MLLWVEACLIAAAIVSIITIIILVITIRRRFALNQQIPAAATTSATEEAWTHTEKRSSYQHIFRRGEGGGGGFTKRFFNWDDHPSLITDAVENGWSKFAFTSCGHAPAPHARPSLFGSLRVGGEYYSNPMVEESWVIGSGSVDFMQKLKFKNMMMMIINGGSIGVKSTVRMVLPLPGPPPSFPQEAYFEITVVDSGEGGNGEGGISEGEKTKLLMKQQQQGYRKSSSTTAIGSNNLCVLNGGAHHLLEELRHGGRRGGGGGGGGGGKVTIGLSVGGFSNDRVPGSYPGSIGFNSDGSVFLNGMKLVFESEKEDWAKPGKVIGCGFDPRKKKVYFTVNSELVHVINCKSEDFGMPLYPLITTSIDITLVVNLGQSRFNYSPSNATRTPNPCFIGLDVNSPTAAALDYEDSQELFSMGRLDDTEWLSHSATTKSTISIISDTNNNRNYGKMEVGEEELDGGDFFEITLDFRKE